MNGFMYVLWDDYCGQAVFYTKKQANVFRRELEVKAAIDGVDVDEDEIRIFKVPVCPDLDDFYDGDYLYS